MKGDETVEDISPNGLKSMDDLALKQNLYRYEFWCYLVIEVLTL